MEKQEYPNRVFISKTIMFHRNVIIIFDLKKYIVMRLICSLYILPKEADPENCNILWCYYRSGCSINIIRIPIYYLIKCLNYSSNLNRNIK